MVRKLSPFLTATFIILSGISFAAQRSAAPAQPPAAPAAAQASGPAYFPDRLAWQHKKPEDVGMDSARLDEAVKLAIAGENSGPQNMKRYQYESYPREPFSDPLG